MFKTVAINATVFFGLLLQSGRDGFIWTPPDLQELVCVCVKIQQAGRQSYTRSVAQTDAPLGPDGRR